MKKTTKSLRTLVEQNLQSLSTLQCSKLKGGQSDGVIHGDVQILTTFDTDGVIHGDIQI